jgi:hypothetical protein
VRHQGAEIANSGKNKAFGAVDVRAAVDQKHGFAETFNGIDNRADIAGAVIKESNHVFYVQMLAGSGEKQYKVRLAGAKRSMCLRGIALVVGVVRSCIQWSERNTM